jgi:hypothetical protein
MLTKGNVKFVWSAASIGGFNKIINWQSEQTNHKDLFSEISVFIIFNKKGYRCR